MNLSDSDKTQDQISLAIANFSIRLNCHHPQLAETLRRRYRDFPPLQITKFEEPSDIVDNRIGGWMEKALELSGYKTVNISITKSLAKGAPFTEFQVSWK